MKFQICRIHRSKVYEISEKRKIKFQNSVIPSKFDKICSKVDQVIFSSSQTSIPNLRALATILFEISCTQGFQKQNSKGDNPEKGHN